MSFYVSITTIKKYKPALDVLLNSLPEEWKSKYILIYQDEDEDTFWRFEDGHIEVYLKNNISDYGNFVGVNMLLELNVVPQNSWFLFIHDTCKFLGNECVELTYNLIKEHNDSDVEIVWLCETGQCNICLIRKDGVKMGGNIYKNIKYLTKLETITYEWQHHFWLSPKSFNVKQYFVNVPIQDLGDKFVYNNVNIRTVLFYKTINMEKYYIPVKVESDHPFSP